jgi:hypothetical protein
MDDYKKHVGGGLLETPQDNRDYSFGAVFGLPELSEIPNKYRTSEPLRIKDQGGSDLCTAFALTAVSEDQEKTELSPEFQFAMTKKLMGDYKPWGADLRAACKSVVKIGSIETHRVPEHLKLKPDNSNRNEIANWENWRGVELYATKHKKLSYFSVDGPHDTFDNMRAVLWQNRAEERSIFTGVVWQHQWTDSKMIKDDTGQKVFGHALKIFGWEGDYLTAQLSNGTEIGDNGVFYFSREVVDRQFTYGQYCFRDMEPVEAKFYMQRGLAYKNSWLRRIIIRLTS